MSQFHFNAIQPLTATASSAAIGYAATNALIPGVMRGWRSAAGGAQWLQLDLGSSKAVQAVCIQAYEAGVGIFSGNVMADNSNPPVTNRGSIVLSNGDMNGRVRASLKFSATVRYIRFNFSGSASAYSVGSVFVFANAGAAPADPLYGASSIAAVHPQVRNELPNGVVESYKAGASAVELDLAYAVNATQAVESMRIAARDGPCWLDFDLTDRSRQWPVRYHEPRSDRRLDTFNRESVSLRFREIT